MLSYVSLLQILQTYSALGGILGTQEKVQITLKLLGASDVYIYIMIGEESQLQVSPELLVKVIQKGTITMY